LTPTEQVEWVKCDCGQMMRRYSLTMHRAKCKGVRSTTPHCQHCAPLSVSDVTDRIRAGTPVDAVALVLGRTLKEVYKVRRRAWEAGCLPRPSADEAEATRTALAKARLGEKECSECRRAFTPRLQSPQQKTCSVACMETRRKRLKRAKAALRPGYKPHEAADPPPETLERQMVVIREKEAALGRVANSVRILTGAESYALWLNVLGVAA